MGSNNGIQYNGNEILEIEFYVRPIKSGNGYFLEISKRVMTPEAIQAIIDIAINEKPVIARIVFKNKPLAILRLVDMGLLKI
ncbi:hypothetical protein DRO97_09995 [Archaeoglobales archaeon]|nr:MAG: hypothetical protein DRO97_09995 [Archaeoglobales archaeon]